MLVPALHCNNEVVAHQMPRALEHWGTDQLDSCLQKESIAFHKQAHQKRLLSHP